MRHLRRRGKFRTKMPADGNYPLRKVPRSKGGGVLHSSCVSSVGSGGSRINVPSQFPTGSVLSFTESPGSPFLNSQAAPNVCDPLPILARAIKTGLRFSRDFIGRVA